MGKRFRYVMFFALCLVFFPCVSHAKCDTQRKAELIKIANNVQLNYTYQLNEEKVPVFHIILSNYVGDIYIMDDRDNIVDDNSINNVWYPSGSNVKFVIYSNDPSCHGEVLTSKYVSIPKYNEFSKMEECREYPDFKYCSLWITSNIFESDFYGELEKYKAKTKDEKKAEVVNKNNRAIIYIVAGLVVIFVIVFIFIRKKLRH